MNLETFYEYCLSKKAVEETIPFGPDVLVFKVMGKMFLLLPLNTEKLQFNVKCNPEKAIELREKYDSVQPGFHMSKQHWNTILVDGTVSTNQLKEWIDDSYNLIVESLPKKKK